MGQNDSKLDEMASSPRSFPLSEEQMNGLSEEVQEVLRNYAIEQRNIEAELKAKYEHLRVDSEQKYFELEQFQRSEHDRLEMESKAASEFRLLLSDLEKRHNEMSEKYRDLQKTFFEKDKLWNGQEGLLLQKNSSLESERTDLIELLKKRNTEIDRLTDESKQVCGKLSEEIQLRLAAQTKADEAQSEMMILQDRDGRLNQELQHLRQQNEVLNDQIQERFNEIMAVRKEKSLRLVELQGLLDNSMAQVSHLEQSLESSKASQAEQSSQIESYIEKLKETRDGHIQMEEQYRNELIAQEKLINLYKLASTEAEKKVQEMAKAVEELQDLLSQGTQAYSELKSEQDEWTKVTQEQLTQRGGKIKELETELVRANELLDVMKKKAPSYISEEDAQAISPAAAASRLLKSGMSLTQIYSEYAETLNQLQLEKEENSRLTSYLDTILQEIEDKAPLIKKQKVDYEESLDTIDRLTSQLDSSLLDCEKSHQMADDNLRRFNDLRRQNERYLVQMKDLTLQKMKRGATVENQVLSAEKADKGRPVTKNESLDEEEVHVPKECMRAKLSGNSEEDTDAVEEINDYATITKKNDELQPAAVSCDAAVSSSSAVSPTAAFSCTTLQDLPLEVLDFILMKAVVKTVIDNYKKLAKSSWIICASRVIKPLRTVWSEWDYRLTTNWFKIVLRRTLHSIQPAPISVQLIAQSPCHAPYFAFGRLNNQIYVFGPEMDLTLHVFEGHDMLNCIKTIPVPSVTDIYVDGMVVCKRSNSMYVWHGHCVALQSSRVIWHLVLNESGGFDAHHWPEYSPPDDCLSKDRSNIREIAVSGGIHVVDDRNVVVVRCVFFCGDHNHGDNIVSVHTPDGLVIRNVKLSDDGGLIMANVTMKSNGNFVFAEEIGDNDNVVQCIIREVDQTGCEVCNFEWLHNCDNGSAQLYLDDQDRVIFHNGYHTLVFLDSELHFLEAVEVCGAMADTSQLQVDFDKVTNEMISMYGVDGVLFHKITL